MQNSSECQKHNTCRKLAQRGAGKCAAVALVMPYKKGNIDCWVLGVGKEVGGRYRGQFNLCAGKSEASDYYGKAFCWLKCALRELREEFKIDVSFGPRFDEIFKNKKGDTRFIIHNRTPVFIAVIPSGLRRLEIKNQMTYDRNDQMKPYSYKEMDDFEFIRLDNGKQIENKNIIVSDFADSIRQKIDVHKF